MPQGELKSEWWFQSQMLRQEGEIDCGVCVFGKLARALKVRTAKLLETIS
jgi:hypothetical protein